MQLPAFSLRSRLTAALALALCAGLCATAGAPRVRAARVEAAPSETRALWVLRSSLTSPASIA